MVLIADKPTNTQIPQIQIHKYHKYKYTNTTNTNKQIPQIQIHTQIQIQSRIAGPPCVLLTPQIVLIANKTENTNTKDTNTVSNTHPDIQIQENYKTTTVSLTI